LQEGKGLTSMEWRHLQAREVKKAAAAGKNASALAPTDDNTIFTLHNETMDLLLADNRNASHLTDIMMELSMTEVGGEAHNATTASVISAAQRSAAGEGSPWLWCVLRGMAAGLRST
jgi:hypothetical protein